MTDQAPDQIRFLERHRPDIEAGDYTIQVTQEISAEKIFEDTFPGPSMTFSIQGERFSLPPAEVHAVFPPDGSMGDHSHVLPHVVLRRSTLPWERRADPADETAPWLALLVFYEGEVERPETMSLKEAETRPTLSGQAVKFHHYEPERGQSEKDQVTVIDVKKELLGKLLPGKKELAWLAHARIRGDNELAVVIANRLPQPKGFSTAHLVSLEGHYDGDKFEKLLEDTADADFIRLVSLASFRFGCFEPAQSFTNLLRALDGATLLRSLDGVKPDPKERMSSTLRLPEAEYPNANDLAGEQLAAGSVPLRHTLRNGQTTVSWYHGPLAPSAKPRPLAPLEIDGESAPALPLTPPKQPQPAMPQTPARASDELLRYDPKTGMFDVSYAAAWELGRLVTLQDKKFSVELRQWKEGHAKLRQLSKPSNAHPLKNPNAPPPNTRMPERLRAWLDGLSLLNGVPFSYLVPDERMLPPESIRVLWLDWFWIECLLDGAFSIGRHTIADTNRDAEHKMNEQITNPHPVVTGVILRSEVVAGWPGLQVDAYDDKQKRLGAPRTQRLSPNVLLCLFDGEIKEVRIHQKVETLHFGLDVDESGNLFKKHRDLKDKQVEVPFKEPKDKRILDIDKLTQRFKQVGGDSYTFTSAEFALQMIEGVEEVTFSIK